VKVRVQNLGGSFLTQFKNVKSEEFRKVVLLCFISCQTSLCPLCGEVGKENLMQGFRNNTVFCLKRKFGSKFKGNVLLNIEIWIVSCLCLLCVFVCL
jgi:hypothetical protein